MSVANDNQPIPWYTYASAAFLKDRIRPEWSVFEYGSGNSTLWWAELVHKGKVISCEHEAAWYEIMRDRVPDHVELHYQALEPEGNYSGFITRHPNRFDVIVIDGRQRLACAEYASGALKSGGVIVWDNSDREDYRPGFDLLQQQGFKRLEFTGMGPINSMGWSTSILYRPNNCLGI
ncbi:MAG: class I SAM-dependent methyltransferase [Planctomycetota bacterium]|nr:class I SAM-dependent methyltransferase [Planctomycetota bacterium]